MVSATIGQMVQDLTNVQFPILNSHPKGEAAASHFGWELSIGN